MVKTHIITNHVSENNLALKVHELPKRSCSMHPKRFQGSGSVSLSWLTGTLDSICANVCQMLGGKEMFDYVMLWGDWTRRPYLSCSGYRKCSSVPFATASKIKKKQSVINRQIRSIQTYPLVTVPAKHSGITHDSVLSKHHVYRSIKYICTGLFLAAE